MCTEARLNKILSALIESYRSVYGSNIADIVLYGSYARGDYTEDSDIDVVAVVHGYRIELQKKLKTVWDVRMTLRYWKCCTGRRRNCRKPAATAGI